MPIFLPRNWASDLICESAGVTNVTSAGAVAPKILIGTPVAAMLNALAPATLKLTSITFAASPLAGALTSAKCTKRTSSMPTFFRKSPVSSTAPRPRLTPLVQ